MHINKIFIQNFKRFRSEYFDFNKDINVLVGDNESGKSTILEAIELCLNLRHHGKPLAASLSADLFNTDAVAEFLAGPKDQGSFPEILIEAYLEGECELKGNNNTLGSNCPGIFVRVFFDPDLASAYIEYSKSTENIHSLPIEFYRYEWYAFSWEKLSPYNKKISCLFVDPTALHPTMGARRYISDILETALEKEDKTILNTNYRQLKAKFDAEPDVVKVNSELDKQDDITRKNLEFSIESSPQTSWENNLQLTLDSIPFSQIGKGEQHQVQMKLALWKKSTAANVVMIEEPEIHLSHMNLVKLVKFIEDKHQGQQIFLTTHSSYVLNKLSFEKICLLADGYKRLHEVEPKTVQTLKRLPGYDTLRVVLSKKVILVEGPSDELVLKKLYHKRFSRLPEEDGIDIIVVRGIGFKNFLNIAQHLGNAVHVVKDNDGDWQRNIVEWKAPFDGYKAITVFSPEPANENSLEPALISANASSQTELDAYAKIVLSSRTFSQYDSGDLAARRAFLTNWFSGDGTGSRKVDSAMRIFESDAEFKAPNYLVEALKFD
ncbi:AAA family ATPase [uncultured Roseobacter sp.]|uniref:ATP-dependent nuclease n=1 Tax=uncultured Roseobacter sp. TaxID=114847 RepID=UPI00260F2AD6|nr:AAA family ATPase [uncultured Roseobacter sp.]